MSSGADEEHHHLTQADWDEIARDEEFIRLVSLRRRFAVPAVFFILHRTTSRYRSSSDTRRLMSRTVFGHLTLAYVYALSEFAMAWFVLALYLARARVFDYLEARFARRIRAKYRT